MSLVRTFKFMVLSEILFCLFSNQILKILKPKYRSTVSVREGQGVVLL